MAPWLLLVVSSMYGYSALEWALKGDWAQANIYAGYAWAGVALYFLSTRALNGS